MSSYYNLQRFNVNFLIKCIFVVTYFTVLCATEKRYDQSKQLHKDDPECVKYVEEARMKAYQNSSSGFVLAPTIELWEAVILMAGTGIFATLLAHLFNYLHTEYTSGRGNLDTAFDAGGRVSIGLTATTIVSQWTWAATLLQSCTVASQYGISGPMWYASGATVQILLFAMLSVQLKIKSPGAKTFLQLVRARFGTKTHVTFCVFALLTNLIITAMLMLGGSAVMTTLIKDFSVQYAVMIMVVVMGTYTWIGGLGATFYVSYFNTAIIFIIMIIFTMVIYHNEDALSGALGSSSAVYKILSCAVGPESNKDRSYLTIVSVNGLTFGVINLVGNFGTVFVDQSYWQSSVAAKPKDGVWGFLAGGLTWFSVPFMFATTMGLSYIVLSILRGEPLLSSEEVEQGLVPVAVADDLMGKSGNIMMLIMILVAVTSTGSAEVIAVTSLMVYDIYQIYLKPFRSTTDPNCCILCGKGRGRMANPRDKCVCESMTFCKKCHADNRIREESRRAVKPDYKCRTHGDYRRYYDLLSGLKNWCMLWTTLSIIPITAILEATGIRLGWLYQFTGIVIGSAVIPIALATFWSRLTGPSMIAGAVGGTIISLTVWLAISSQFPGGIWPSSFFMNTGQQNSMFWGNLTAIVSGGLITIVMSFITNWKMDIYNISEIWENTRDIDNPLFPWTELYARELNISGANKLDNRPSLEEVNNCFKSAKWVAYIGAIILTLVLIVLWPAGMVAAGVLQESGFKHWVNISEAWGWMAAIFIIIIPVVNEIQGMMNGKREQKRVGDTVVENEKASNLYGRNADKSAVEMVNDGTVETTSNNHKTGISIVSVDTGHSLTQINVDEDPGRSNDRSGVE